MRSPPTAVSPPGPIVESPGHGIGRPGVSERRRVLWIVALASVPLIVLVLAGIWEGKVRAERQVADERIGLARAGALTTFAFVDGNLSTARSLAHTAMIVEGGTDPDVGPFLDEVLAENPDWDGWGIAGADGWNVASTGAAPHTLYVGDRPYYQQAIQTGKPVVSPAVFNRRLNIPTVVLAAPIDFADGGRGSIIVSLSTARLAGELGALRRDTSIRIGLVDSAGNLFIHPNMDLANQLPSLRGDPSVDDALAGQVGSTLMFRSDGQQVIVAHAPVPDLGWGILVSQPTNEAFDVVQRQTLLGIVVLALAAIMAGGIGWYLGGRLSKIYQQQQAARAQAEATAERLVVVSAESERRRRFFESVIQSAPIAIAIMGGPELVYEAVNPPFQALRPGTPMLGRTVAEIFTSASETGFLELLRRVYQTGEQYVGVDRAWQTPAEDPTPPVRYFTFVVSRLDDEAGQPDTILSMVLETTESVVARQKADREKDEFLSIASHELKTPLTALGLAAQLVDRLMAQRPLDEARLIRHNRTIQNQVTRMSTLINDLLFMSRIDARRLTLTAGRVNLVTLARDAAERQRDTLPEDSSERIVVESEQAAIEVHGDPTRIGQVFTNLLSNAIKYTPDGGPINVLLGASSEQATIKIVDHGIGVPEDERAEIFSPFRRASTAIKAAIEGTGLGLYITRRIVEAHGGTIRLTETPGGGTTFEVTLPMGRPGMPSPAGRDAQPI